MASGCRPRRAEVVANGIDVEEFRPDAAARRAVRTEVGIAHDAIVLAHVARVDAMKIMTISSLRWGSCPTCPQCWSVPGTENLPAAHNVLRLGRHHDVARLFAAAVEFARGEGFSNVLGEGMACGLAAVATDVGDAKLIVGDTGLVVPPENPGALAAAIRALACEPALARAERGRRARARIVENFAMSRALQCYRQLYASLASSRG